MQINNVNNVKFGYNGQLNGQVVQKLTKARSSKPFFDTVLKLNELTNETELKLRIAEKRKNTALAEKLTDVFVTLKDYVSSIIETNFPKLNYCSLEAATYAEELEEREITDKEHWLNEVIDALIINDSKVMDLKDLPEEIQAKLTTTNSLVDDEEELSGAELGKKLLKEYVPTEASKLGFAALGGMTELKKTLNERIVGALKNPEQARLDAIEYGKKMPNGILMYGPPGCGKTTIIEHLSTEAGVPLLKLEIGSVGSSYIHDTSKNLDAAFDYAESIATKDKPVVLMIDDADALLSARKDSSSSDFHYEELSTFLNRIQKAGSGNVVVTAATNRYDLLDEAIRSRFEEQIYVGLPDKEARKSIVKLFMNSRTKGKALADNEKAIDKIADLFDKFPIRAMKMISEKASLEALNDGRRDIELKDFEKVIAQNQKMKVKEQNYKSDSELAPVGFNRQGGE